LAALSLIVQFRRFDGGQDLALDNAIADISRPVGQITADPRVNDRLVPRAGFAGQSERLRRRRVTQLATTSTVAGAPAVVAGLGI